MTRQLVIKLTCSLDDAERAHTACNVAAVGLASGVDVHLFLAGEGVRLALPDVARQLDIAHAPPTDELVDAVYAGGAVTVCTPCARRRALPPEAFRDGTQMGGAAQFVELATAPDATALVY